MVGEWSGGGVSIDWPRETGCWAVLGCRHVFPLHDVRNCHKMIFWQVTSFSGNYSIINVRKSE